MTITAHPHDLVLVDDDAPVAVADGNSWTSEIYGTTGAQSMNGGFSLDLQATTTASSPSWTITIRAGNYLRTVSSMPDVTPSSGLPTYSSGVPQLINIENLRARWFAIDVAISGGDVTIDHAVLRYQL